MMNNKFLIFFVSMIINFSLASQKESEIEPHVVYSHAWYEDTSYTEYDHNKESWLLPYNNQYCDNLIMSFKENKSIKNSTGKNIILSDDNTSFYNSYAMKFAFLGDSLSMPSYRDKPYSWSLYSERTVHALADHLYNRVIKEKRQKIILVGPCVGASIAINCLKKLVNFNENQNYFKNTSIQSDNDVQQIINAINNGAFIAIVPLMSIKQHNAVAMPATILSGLTLATMAIAANHYNSEVSQLGLISAGLLASFFMGNYIKNIYTTLIKYSVVSFLSKSHYNPFHEDPIDNIESLKGKITCPVILNFTEKDWIMEWQNDLIKLYEAFDKDTRIIFTKDKGHMEISPIFLESLQKSFKDKKQAENFVDDSNIESQINELRQKIYPLGIVSHIFGAKKWIISLVFLSTLLIWLKMNHVN